MKVESRGKYGGVKVHLDPEECELLIKAVGEGPFGTSFALPLKHVNLALKMGKKIKDLLEENPELLKERTPEQVAAILAKESEKAALQLNAVKAGKNWAKVDPAKLQEALLKHVK